MARLKLIRFLVLLLGINWLGCTSQDEVSQCITLIKKGSKEAKLKAIYMLDKLNDKRGIAGLLIALKDPDKEIRIAASGRLIFLHCLLYTSPSPRDLSTSRMPSSA